MPGPAGQARWPTALAELAENPANTALMFDVDGTLAAIADRPERAAVPRSVAVGLDRLAGRYLLVACVTGRPALEARGLVGASELTYVGLHGLEWLRPGADAPEVEPGAAKEGDAIRALSEERSEQIEAAGLRVEDKHPITALHWRGAADEREAADMARQVAQAALDAGASVKPGRKVIELRPESGCDKGEAVIRLLAESGADRALYAGDDVTDIDAFRALGRLRVERGLRRVVRVAVASAEEPAELRSRADVVVEGVDDVAHLIEYLG